MNIGTQQFYLVYKKYISEDKMALDQVRAFNCAVREHLNKKSNR